MAKTTDDDQSGKSTGVADVRAAVENAKNAKDESQDSGDDDDTDDDDASDDDGEGDDDGSDDSSDDAGDSDDADGDEDGDDDEDKDNPDKSKSQTKRHFAQYAGDGTDKSYISNLEKAHQSSTTEAINLQTELNQATSRIDAIMRAAAADKDLAAKLNDAMKGDGSGGSGEGDGASGAENPFVRDLQAQWAAKSEEEIDKFIEANPEVASDPKIKADVQYWMGIFSNKHFERTGRLLSGGDAMAQAYKHLGLENKLEKQNLAAGAKKSAAPTRPRGKAKRSNGQKPSFTSDQLAMAKALGRDETWLAKNAK